MTESKLPDLADFWLPESEAEITDPRIHLWKELCDRGVEIRGAVEVEDSNCPPSFLGVSAGWAHTIFHGEHTRDTFSTDLAAAVVRLAELIADVYSPFEPIRFYRDAVASYGVSPYTFRGSECPFDLRLIGMVERSISIPIVGDDEPVHGPGIKWYLSTMVVPDKDRDKDVYVGYDYGQNYDG